jgi:hypothetical protein
VYVQEEHHHSVTLTQVLIACIVMSFALAAMNIAYAAGRQAGADPTRAETHAVLAPPG